MGAPGGVDMLIRAAAHLEREHGWESAPENDVDWIRVWNQNAAVLADKFEQQMSEVALDRSLLQLGLEVRAWLSKVKGFKVGAATKPCHNLIISTVYALSVMSGLDAARNLQVVISILARLYANVIAGGGTRLTPEYQTQTVDVCRRVLGVILKRVSVDPTEAVTDLNAMTQRLGGSERGASLRR